MVVSLKLQSMPKGCRLCTDGSTWKEAISSTQLTICFRLLIENCELWCAGIRITRSICQMSWTTFTFSAGTGRALRRSAQPLSILLYWCIHVGYALDSDNNINQLSRESAVNVYITTKILVDCDNESDSLASWYYYNRLTLWGKTLGRGRGVVCYTGIQ